MLAEDRCKKILDILDSMGSVTVQQLMDELDISESTIRRDLVAMDKKGYLTKVHGGAIANNTNIHTQDEKVINRLKQNRSEKEQIARYAASLIVDNDFVYIDAGTTTAVMIDYITAKNVVFVTNSLTNAKRISDRGYTVYILDGLFQYLLIFSITYSILSIRKGDYLSHPYLYYNLTITAICYTYQQFSELLPVPLLMPPQLMNYQMQLN